MRAPMIVCEMRGRPSWSGKCEQQISALELCDMLRFVRRSARVLGGTDARNQQQYEPANPFLRGFLDSLPHDHWNVAYAAGWAEVQSRFVSTLN